MKMKELWDRSGLINSDGQICWSDMTLEQQIAKAKADATSCGCVNERKVILPDGTAKTYMHYYFFGCLVEKEYVLNHFSETPGLEKWLKGYGKHLFVFIPACCQLFKIKDREQITLMSR